MYSRLDTIWESGNGPTGPGIPFALPALCIPAAQKYPGLKIILAHAGWGIFSAEAQVAASVAATFILSRPGVSARTFGG